MPSHCAKSSLVAKPQTGQFVCHCHGQRPPQSPLEWAVQLLCLGLGGQKVPKTGDGFCWSASGYKLGASGRSSELCPILKCYILWPGMLTRNLLKRKTSQGHNQQELTFFFTVLFEPMAVCIVFVFVIKSLILAPICILVSYTSI